MSGLAKLGLSNSDYVNPSVADIRGYFSGSGINTTTGVITDTNTTYSASDFAITGLSGYSAGAYLNSEVTYAELQGTKPPTNAEPNPTVADVRGYFSGTGINTSTGVITNSQYAASDFNITGLSGYSAAAYANASVVATATVDGANTVAWSKFASGNFNPNTTTHTWSVTWKNGAGTTLATSSVVANLDTTNTDLNAPTITANASGSGVTSSVSGTGTTAQTIPLSSSGFNDVVLKAVIYVVTGFSFKFNVE